MSCLLAAFATQPVSAALPTLQNQSWLGYYAVYADRNYEFKIAAADGAVTLISLGEGAPILGNLLIQVKFGIVEIASADVRIAAYGKGKFLFTASPESALRLSNTKALSLSEGFSIKWSPDPDKNKDGKARHAIEVK
jgi:hypothetical protein